MLNTLLASKKKMGVTFIKDTRVPVTYVSAGPCVVTFIKKLESDGYWAVQLGFGTKRIKNITKPLQGHLKTVIHDKKAPKYIKEVRLTEEPKLKVGDIVKLTDVFSAGDIVTVTGISKGKGFAGVVKRWKFAGGPKTHGQSDRLRAPGSIGQGTTPGRVYKGKKMAGRMGQDQVTVKNLTVVLIDPEKNEMAIKGALPGPSGELLIIKKTASGKLEELVEVAPEVVEQEDVEQKEENPSEVKNESKVEEGGEK